MMALLLFHAQMAEFMPFLRYTKIISTGKYDPRLQNGSEKAKRVTGRRTAAKNSRYERRMDGRRSLAQGKMADSEMPSPIYRYYKC